MGYGKKIIFYNLGGGNLKKLEVLFFEIVIEEVRAIGNKINRKISRVFFFQILTVKKKKKKKGGWMENPF